MPESEGPSASRHQKSPYELPVDSYGPDDLPVPHQIPMSKEEVENQLGGTPSMFDQTNTDPNDDTQNQEALRTQLEQLQSQIKGMQAKQQDEGYRKEFEDTTGGTSGVDMNESAAKDTGGNSGLLRDEYQDEEYDDDQKELTGDVNEGLLLDNQETTQYGKIEQQRRQTEQVDD